MNLAELEEWDVCCVRRRQTPPLMLVIRDRFWPYQREQMPAHVEWNRGSPKT